MSASGNSSVMTSNRSDALDHLLKQGYVILPRMLSDASVDQLERELAPWFEATPHCEGDFHGWQTTRIASVLLKARTSHRLLLDPHILSLMDAVLGPHCDWYQLNLAQAIRLHPGQRQQFPHRDEDMWPCHKAHEYMVNVMWALCDFTADNGATLLWPRSSATTDAMPDAADAIAAVMPRGSALVYLGSTIHCGGSNRATRPRTGLVLSYCLGWLKTYENSFLAYPASVARSFPKEVRDLIGYRMHRPNLGNYEGQDPAVALTSDSRTLATVDALPSEVADRLRTYYSA
jgi:ectoine hydroxylase-related dioxygenase (phytanoyl-CoA dioxygenase family)